MNLLPLKLKENGFDYEEYGPEDYLDDYLKDYGLPKTLG